VSWQDLVFSVGSLLFTVALLPAVFGPRDRVPPLMTSLMTGGILVVFVPTYASLDLWWSVATGTSTALCWLVLAGRRLR
jgi:hypothetical protein